MAETQNIESIKKFQYGYVAITSLGVVLMGSVLFWIVNDCGGFSWTSQPSIQFNWHPMLMTVGMIFLYGQATMMFRLLRDTTKETVKLVHGGLNFTIIILVIIAQIAVLDSHNLNPIPIPNFYTLHSWIGLLTLFMFVAQYGLGFVSFLYPKLSATFRKSYLHYHINIGSAIVVLIAVTAISGLLQKAIFKYGAKYGELPSECVRMNLIGLLIALYALLVLYFLKENKYRRLTNAEEHDAVSHLQME